MHILWQWKQNPESPVFLSRAMLVLVILLSPILPGGCDDPGPQAPARVRAIKPYHISEPARGQLYRYSGTIVATDSSKLSFAVSGTINTVAVLHGDRVAKGDLLASLDPAPFLLEVQAAKAQRATAQANYENSLLENNRNRQLYERNWVSKAAYDKAISTLAAAKGELDFAISRLALVERDLASSRLRAPFAGVIARRDVEPFVEIAKGQTLFQLDSEGNFDIKISVPDKIIGRVTRDVPVTVEVLNIQNCGCSGRIKEIGTEAGVANDVTIRVEILQNPGGLLSGMAGEVSIILDNAAAISGFLVPSPAIAPGDENAQAYIFKFDPVNSVVRKIPIRSSNLVHTNQVGVNGALKSGDIIAAAGVSFLRDGQNVTLAKEK